MLRIRLTRVGKKKQPHYRVVVADIEAPRDGRIVERIGYYSPLTESDLVDIDEERALYWLSVGAQPTDTVRSLLRKQGTLERLARLHAGEPMEMLVTEYQVATGELEAEPAPSKRAATPVAAEEPVAEEPVAEETAVTETAIAETAVEEEETIVEEPATEVGEAYAEAEEEGAVAEATETAGEVIDSAATTVTDVAEDAVDAVSDAVADAVADAAEAVAGSEEEE